MLTSVHQMEPAILVIANYALTRLGCGVMEMKPKQILKGSLVMGGWGGGGGGGGRHGTIPTVHSVALNRNVSPKNSIDLHFFR